WALPAAAGWEEAPAAVGSKAGDRSFHSDPNWARNGAASPEPANSVRIPAKAARPGRRTTRGTHLVLPRTSLGKMRVLLCGARSIGAAQALSRRREDCPDCRRNDC